MSHHPFFVAVRDAGATEFAVVDGLTRHWFHGHIARNPDGPEGVWVDYSWAERESVNQRTRLGGDPTRAIFEMLNQWLNTMTGRNPGRCRCSWPSTARRSTCSLTRSTGPDCRRGSCVTSPTIHPLSPSTMPSHSSDMSDLPDTLYQHLRLAHLKGART